MNKDNNILHLDNQIKKKIKKVYNSLQEYKDRITEINKLLLNTSILFSEEQSLRKELKEKIDLINDIETNNMFSEYICMSKNIIKEYLSTFNKPKNFDFFGKSIDKDNTVENETNDLFNQFLSIAKKYLKDELNLDTNCKNNTKMEENLCTTCDINDWSHNEYSKICNICGTETILFSANSNFKDIKRINLNPKYKYQRKVHFRDALNCYQGKQNKTIPEKVYSALEAKFKIHNLLAENDDFHVRHKNITKEHIHIFLKETKNNGYYEDTSLLHFHFTGISCPDLTHIEEELMEDFNKIVEVYDTLDLTSYKRKNFLNCQYILKQLIGRKGIETNINDFDILETHERKKIHDEIYEKICLKLEWNFIPIV